MTDFLLELLSEEIPARMQAKASADLAAALAKSLAEAGIKAEAIEHYATPRRLALIARGLPAETTAVREELKGPRTSAPSQALEGFLRKTGLTREQLEERDGTLFAVIEKPGRPLTELLAGAIPAIVRNFTWPKSMRWGDASISTESPRWVRPLQGVVALFGEEIVDFEVAGVRSGAATVGHRFHHPGCITIGSADDYAAKLRACHVILDPAERESIIALGATTAAAKAGLTLVRDEGLLAENAGLTEWPVPLLGSFDPAFLDVPPEVIQLTMRTNQKYFACLDGEGRLAPNFICTANIDAHDGGAAIVAGNEKVLAARLADAKFFWEQDLKILLEDQANKLDQIVFHEKLGTVADKVERVAKLARWLVEENIVIPAKAGIHKHDASGVGADSSNAESMDSRLRGNDGEGLSLADMAEQAARLCKADLVTGMVGEFPELQGVMGGHYARAQGLDPQVADAIRDHYKPVGQGDDVPTAPVTVAVSLADKLDTLTGFFGIDLPPSGSRDPFALRRAGLGLIALIIQNGLRFDLQRLVVLALTFHGLGWWRKLVEAADKLDSRSRDSWYLLEQAVNAGQAEALAAQGSNLGETLRTRLPPSKELDAAFAFAMMKRQSVTSFLGERLTVQQRDNGIRPDLIASVFSQAGEGDLVRLLARVKALQAFVGTDDGANLLAGYKRAANILKKEGCGATPVIPAKAGTHELDSGNAGADSPASAVMGPGLRRDDDDAVSGPSHSPAPEESALIVALDAAEPRVAAAIDAEDFTAAMTALASLRAPIDAFFDKVTVNDPDPAKRAARLNLLARVRDAVHRVADFSKIEG